MKRILVGLGVVAVAWAAPISQAQAQNFPTKSVRWIVPYPAGGGSDFLARTVSQAMAQDLGQPVVIDNRAGGNTAIAAAETIRSGPDGYTVLSADNGTLFNNPVLYSSLSYKASDLTPVTLLGRFPMILAVGPSGAEFKDAKDFIAKVKAAPGKYSYASVGAGSPHHLAMELLKQKLGLHILHIPYRGAAPAMNDVVGGQLPVMMIDPAAGAGFLKAGKLRPLAVANDKRLPQYPNVPTFDELGIKGVEAAALVGMVAPTGTPPAVIARLQQAASTAIHQPDVFKKLADAGVEPVGGSTADYAALIKQQTALWQKLITDLKIKLD